MTNARTLLSISLLAFSVFGGACGRVSVDATSSDPRANRTLQTGTKAGKTLYNGWTIYDAWDDAVEKIGPHDELKIGQLATVSVIALVGDLVLEDDTLVRYVNSVGNHVALQGQRHVKSPRMKGRRFFFGIVRSKEVNAFSTPGGNVLITTGLLEQLNDEAELAFVLGHEIAHADYEHGLSALKTAVRTDEAMKSSIQILLRRDKDKEPVANLFDDLGVVETASYKFGDLVVNKGGALFSVSQEGDADAKGVEYAAKAGYDPAAAVRVVQMLRDVKGGAKTMSHGLPETRIKNLEAHAKKHPAGKSGYSRWQERGLARLEAANAAAEANTSAPAP